MLGAHELARNQEQATRAGAAIVLDSSIEPVHKIGVAREVLRTIDDGQQANAIGSDTADVLRGIATRLPIGLVLAVLRGASGLLPS